MARPISPEPVPFRKRYPSHHYRLIYGLSPPMASPEFSMPVAGVPRKPKTSVYTILLVISLIALLTGCVFLFLEIKRFGGFGTVRGTVQITASPANIQFAALANHEKLLAV